MYIYIYIGIHTYYIHIYIYIQRERERSLNMCIQQHMCVYNMLCIYIYIYIHTYAKYEFSLLESAHASHVSLQNTCHISLKMFGVVFVCGAGLGRALRGAPDRSARPERHRERTHPLLVRPLSGEAPPSRPEGGVAPFQKCTSKGT